MFTVIINKYSHEGSAATRVYDEYETLELASAAARVCVYGLNYRFAIVLGPAGETVYNASRNL